MNWAKGLFRIWLLCTALWLAGVAYFANKVFSVPAPFYGDYQYSMQTRDMPWRLDWTKPLYENIYAPGKGKFPESFPLMTDDLAQKWEVEVKAGRMIVVDFPDQSHLYLSSELTKDDQQLLANMFWEQRWSRYTAKILWWITLAFGPPLILFAVAGAIRWISRGFRPAL